MHACPVPVSSRVTKGRQQRQVAPAGNGAANFLSLPAIDKSIPVEARSEAREAKKWRQIAELCAELIDPDEVRVSHDASLQNIIEACLHGWVSKHCGDIELLDGFAVISACDVNELYASFYDLDETLFETHWVFALESNDSASYFNVKDSLLELEALVPGLGRTAMHYAEVASFKTITAFTPIVAKDYASYRYWEGEEDDEQVKMMWAGNGEGSPEELDVLLPSQFDSKFPELFLRGDVLPRESLLSTATRKDKAGEVSKLILSIVDLIEQGAQLPGLYGCEQQPSHYSCILGTGEEGDTLLRVLDDFVQEVHCYGSDSYTHMSGMSLAPFDRAEFQKWRLGMEKGFALYAAFDRLLQQIGQQVQ